MNPSDLIAAFVPFLVDGVALTAVLGVLFGLVIGVIPGLGPVTAVALAVPLTFGVEPVNGITFLLAVYAGCVSGGAASSVLLNIPGTTGSIPTCFDGFPMSQAGRGNEALSVGIVSSAVGALGGAIAFLALGPVMGDLSSLLQPADYTMLTIVAFAMVALGSREDGIKGLAMAGAGLMVAFIGRDTTTATARFTGDRLLLDNGIPFVAATLGLYAMSQVIKFAAERGPIATVAESRGGVLKGFVETFRSPMLILRSWVIGVVVGILPGIGITLSGLLSWTTQRRFDKDRATYGKGNPRGIVASECANNATATASLATTFALGIPGGATDAILLGGLLLYGLRPGKGFFEPSGDPLFFAEVAWGMLLVPFVILACVLLLKPMARLTQLPLPVLVPIIATLSVLGAYSTRNQVFDVWVMLFFGVLGYILERGGYPIQNMVIGMVLGVVLEQNINRTLILSRGSLGVFWERPISRVALLATIAILIAIVAGFLRSARPRAKFGALALLDNFDGQAR